MGVTGADEVAADVGPAPQVVDPVQAAHRLVDGVEVRGQQDLAALGQGVGQGAGVGSTWMPSWAVRTFSDRDGAMVNTVVSGPTNTQHHQRWLSLPSTAA